MSNAYEIKGRIKLIGETQTFASGFAKREIVITTDEKYPQEVKLDFVKEGCDRLEVFTSGDVVKIAFNVRGNEYKGKYYVSLQGWKIEREGGTQDAHNESKSNGYQQQRATSQNTAPPPSKTATADALDFEEDDEIPF